MSWTSGYSWNQITSIKIYKTFIIVIPFYTTIILNDSQFKNCNVLAFQMDGVTQSNYFTRVLKNYPNCFEKRNKSQQEGF